MARVGIVGFLHSTANDGVKSLSLSHMLNLLGWEQGYHIKVFCFEPGLRFALGFHVELSRLPEWFVSFHIGWWDIHLGRWGSPTQPSRTGRRSRGYRDLNIEASTTSRSSGEQGT